MKNILLFIAALFSSIFSTAQIITTFAGTGIAGYSGDNGPAISAQFNYTGGLVFSNNGSLFICDAANNRIRKIDAAGIITTFAGNGTAGFSGDGGPADSAQIKQPHDITIDAIGNLYFSDFYNNRIRKVDTAGIITTFAGDGSNSVGGDGGPATSAQLALPDGVCVDDVGNVYIAEGNFHVVRKVDTAGIITTICGTGTAGYNGDGILASTAQLNFPSDVIRDLAGNIYVLELFGARLRKIATTGMISTIAGTGAIGYNGDGIPATTAQLNKPTCLNLDLQGNIFIADNDNNRIRKIDNMGIITTVAGTGLAGYSGDGGPATLAKLFFPYSMAFNSIGNLFITDSFNYRIREVVFINTAIAESVQIDNEIKIFPNPSSGNFTILLPVKTQKINITNSIGELIEIKKISAENTTGFKINSNGIYFVQIITDEGTTVKKVIINK